MAFHHEDAPVAPDLPARRGRHAGAAAARVDDPGGDRARPDGRAAAHAARRASTSRTARSCRSGRRPPRAPASSSREILQPLKPFYDQINVISDLRARAGLRQRRHGESQSLGRRVPERRVRRRPARSRQLGITVDQIAAQKIGQDTPLPSLELTIEEPSLNCGDGLSCSYRDTISWQGPHAPLPMQNNPQVVFERLFGDGNTAEQRKARREQSISLLDSVLGEASALQRKLPASDRTRLDQYLTDVREIERRVQKAGQQLSDDLPIPAAPTGVPRDVEEHIKLMFDLQVLAWQAEITRVSTFLMCKELSNAVYPKSGVRDAFHTLSHHSNVPGEHRPLRGAEHVPRRRCSPTSWTSCRRRRTATARCSITRWCCTAAA